MLVQLLFLLAVLRGLCRAPQVDDRFQLQKEMNCSKTCGYCENKLIFCTKLDQCGCCEVCLRQYGEFCNANNLCDYRKNLFCKVQESNNHGICLYILNLNKDSYSESNERICIFNGMVYESQVRFSVSCRHRCQCNDGLVTCQDLCQEIEQSLPPPLSICPNGAELIPPTDNQCCREWSCKNDYSGIFADQLVNYIRKRTAFKRLCIHKLQFETQWSQCSKTCGMGISTRTSTNNLLCQNITQKRFCMYKECQDTLDPFFLELKPQNCSPTTRSKVPLKIRIVLKDDNANRSANVTCQSKRKFRPRVCGNCSECCRPIRSKTKRIEFQCSDYKVRILMYEWIKTCRCGPDLCK